MTALENGHLVERTMMDSGVSTHYCSITEEGIKCLIRLGRTPWLNVGDERLLPDLTLLGKYNGRRTDELRLILRTAEVAHQIMCSGGSIPALLHSETMRGCRIYQGGGDTAENYVSFAGLNALRLNDYYPKWSYLEDGVHFTPTLTIRSLLDDESQNQPCAGMLGILDISGESLACYEILSPEDLSTWGNPRRIDQTLLESWRAIKRDIMGLRVKERDTHDAIIFYREGKALQKLLKPRPDTSAQTKLPGYEGNIYAVPVGNIRVCRLPILLSQPPHG